MRQKPLISYTVGNYYEREHRHVSITIDLLNFGYAIN